MRAPTPLWSFKIEVWDKEKKMCVVFPCGVLVAKVSVWCFVDLSSVLSSYLIGVSLPSGEVNSIHSI